MLATMLETADSESVRRTTDTWSFASGLGERIPTCVCGPWRILEDNDPAGYKSGRGVAAKASVIIVPGGNPTKFKRTVDKLEDFEDAKQAPPPRNGVGFRASIFDPQQFEEDI